ncbi:hypothetical protein IWQ62_002710 [Dispira parvispora]|uniref:U1-type domain-containing protein n=1 Tax=Dispira parvispora TaxID=1520584 RepID=A0A9W8APE4_9FUNG|nr:hypothetical protein IWQ62_002710 [Dispira parvispora]
MTKIPTPAPKDKRPSTRFCEACQVNVPAGPINWPQHLHGKKHLTNVQLRSRRNSGTPPNGVGFNQHTRRPLVPRENKRRPSAASSFRSVSPVGRQGSPSLSRMPVDSYKPMYAATTMGPRTTAFPTGHSRRSSIDSGLPGNIHQSGYSLGNSPGQMPAAGYKVTTQPLQRPKSKPPHSYKPISLETLFPYDPEGLDYSKIG